MVLPNLQQMTQSAQQKLLSINQDITNARNEVQRIENTTGSTSTSRALKRQIDEDFDVRRRYAEAELSALSQSSSPEEAKSRVSEATSQVHAGEIAYLRQSIGQQQQKKLLQQENAGLITIERNRAGEIVSYGNIQKETQPKITPAKATPLVGPTRGTYDISTGVYTDTAGNKQSVISKPAGAKVINSAEITKQFFTRDKYDVTTPFKEIIASQQSQKSEEQRITNLKENIISSGGHKVTTNYIDNKTNNTIQRETVYVNKIVNGKKVDSKVVTETNLNTGEKSIKTYEIPKDKKTSSSELSGGLSYTKQEEKQVQKIPSMIGVYKEPTLLERFKIIFYKVSPYFRDYVDNIAKGIDRLDEGIAKIGVRYGIKKEFVEKRINIEKDTFTNQMINLNKSMQIELSNAKTGEQKKVIIKKYTEKISNLEKNQRSKMALLQRDLVNNIFISDVAIRLSSSGASSLKFGKEILTNKQYREEIITGINNFNKDKKFRDEAIKTIQNSIGDSWNRYVNLWKVSPNIAIISTAGILLEGYIIGKAFQPVRVLKLIGAPLRNFPKVMKILGIVGTSVKAFKEKGKSLIKLGIKTSLVSIGKGTVGEGVTTGIALAGKKIASKYKKLIIQVGKEKVVLRGRELEKYINLRKEISSQQALEKIINPIKRQTNSVGIFIKSPQGQIPTQQVSLIAHRVGINLPKKVLDNISNMNVIVDSTPYIRLRKIIESKLINKKVIFSIKNIEEKYYQNIINFGFYSRDGKFLFSATTSIISKSRIKNLPRTLTPFEAIKLAGSNRQFIISKSVRKNTIKSLVAELDQSRNKILKEYITKYKQIPTPEKFKTLIDFSTERVLRDKSKSVARLTDLGFEQTLRKTTKFPTGVGRLSIEKRPTLISIKQNGITQNRLGVLEIIKSTKNIERVIDSVNIPKSYTFLGKQGFEAVKSRELFLKKLKTFSIKVEK
ncbi:MAG: hypothetical protein IMZ60_00430, partial [Actinobacteria bacterium]|nr:hypothetical protein [Actinomycetota bacterium]